MHTRSSRLLPLALAALVSVGCDTSTESAFDVREAVIHGPVASYVIETHGAVFELERLEAGLDVVVFVTAEDGTRLNALASPGGVTYLDASFGPLGLTAVGDDVRTVVDTVIEAHPLEGTPLPSFRRMKGHDNCFDLMGACAVSGNAYEFCQPGMLEYYCSL